MFFKYSIKHLSYNCILLDCSDLTVEIADEKKLLFNVRFTHVCFLPCNNHALDYCCTYICNKKHYSTHHGILLYLLHSLNCLKLKENSMQYELKQITEFKCLFLYPFKSTLDLSLTEIQTLSTFIVMNPSLVIALATLLFIKTIRYFFLFLPIFLFFHSSFMP